MKKIALTILAPFVLIFLVATIRSLTISSKQVEAAPAPPLRIDAAAALERFSRSLKFRTISADPAIIHPEHDAFVAWLGEAFPRVHASLSREVFNQRSLLFIWQGSDSSLRPALLIAHYDVVPVEPGTESRWPYPPFSGANDGTYIWGRGALDNKAAVMGILEAVESLLAEGFRPRRTIMIALGHDEELGGFEGARKIAEELESRGIRFEVITDEGSAIVSGVVQGLTRPAALIGIAEKGFASVELRVTTTGGHSSMPPSRTAVGVLAEAVDRLQKKQFPMDLRPPVQQIFRWLAPEMKFPERLILSNLWLFEPVLKMQARKSNPLAAALRTTTAPTVITGGVKDNVIPSEGRAVVNFRILPGDSVEEVVRHTRAAVDNPDVTIRVQGISWEPSGISDPEAPQFTLLARTIRAVFPDAVAGPLLVLVATDSRHFSRLSPNIYRFNPHLLALEDLDRVHGSNERIAVRSYLQGIRFYRLWITTLGS